MANKPCNQCDHYDGQKKHSPSGPRDAWLGWCKKMSKYPHTDPDGMVVPADVVRVAEGERAEPYIVAGNKVKLNCLNFIQKA